MLIIPILYQKIKGAHLMKANSFPDRYTVERLRKMYPKGTRVELIEMDDPYSDLTPGESGTVSFIDDAGTIFVDWDSGSTLGIIYGVDRIRKL